MNTFVSEKCAGLSMSAIKKMAILSAGVPGAASLAWGLPSFRTPKTIRMAIKAALEQDPTAGMYTLPAGLPELLEACAAEFETRFGRRVDPERNMVISAGNMEAMNTLLNVLVDPGDEVIVPSFTFFATASAVTPMVVRAGRRSGGK